MIIPIFERKYGRGGTNRFLVLIRRGFRPFQIDFGVLFDRQPTL